MSKITKEGLFDEFKKTGEFCCPFCLRSDWECLEDLAQHIEIDHQYEIQETEEALSNLTSEQRQTIDNWLTERKRMVLEKAYTEQPEKFRLYQKDDMALEKAVKDSLWREALSKAGRELSTLDAMFLRSMPISKTGQCPDGYCLIDFGNEKRCIPQSAWNAYNQYKASREKPEHQPQTGESTGQTEEYFPIDSPNEPALRILEKASENLSGEDQRKKKELILVLTALVRKRK